MSNNLMQAHREWATRPADERFQTLATMDDAASTQRGQCVDGRLDMTGAHLDVNGSIVLYGAKGGNAKLTHWSAGQLCSKLGVPRDLLTKLDPSVASAVLNDRLPKSIAEGDVHGRQRVLLHEDADCQRTLRAFHGKSYDRLWDAQVTHTLREWLPQGWRNPVAYAGGQWGAELVPSGLYKGDRSMFAFFIDGGDSRDDNGTFDVDGDAFNRGFFCWNSEVGAASFGWMSFMFRRVCGNNIVWGASDVAEFRARHTGKGATRMLYAFREYLNTLNEDASVNAFQNAVRNAQQVVASPIKASKAETLDDAFSKFKNTFTKAEITLALDAMLREEGTSVRGTQWDWLQGFTAVARTYANADDRAALEAQASKVLLK